MTGSAWNSRSYGRLLAKAAPRIIRSEEECRRLLAIVENLLAKGELRLTPEEDTLLELLTALIEDYERHAHPLPDSSPSGVIAFLLEQRGLAASSLWPVVGSKSRVSEILSGRREPTKQQAKRLAEFFGVGVGAFL